MAGGKSRKTKNPGHLCSSEGVNAQDEMQRARRLAQSMPRTKSPGWASHARCAIRSMMFGRGAWVVPRSSFKVVALQRQLGWLLSCCAILIAGLCSCSASGRWPHSAGAWGGRHRHGRDTLLVQFHVETNMPAVFVSTSRRSSRAGPPSASYSNKDNRILRVL